MSLGMPEILLILAVVLLFFGPSRLPGVGKSIGEAIRSFKKGMNDAHEDIETQARKDESKEKLSSPSQNQTAYHTETEKSNETENSKESEKKKS